MPEDLMAFGLIPEFVGRLPVVSAVHQLTQEDLVEILTEPKNALVRQYQRFFGYDSIELVFTEDALWEISEHALARETGARGLRSIIELALLDVMFELPSRTDVTKCVITKETISKGLKPTLVTSAEGGRRRARRARRRVRLAPLRAARVGIAPCRRYLVERHFTVTSDGMPTGSRTSVDWCFATSVTIRDRLGAQPRRRRRRRDSEVLLHLRGAERGDGARAHSQLLGAHHIANLHEIAGDVTPTDFPLDESAA